VIIVFGPFDTETDFATTGCAFTEKIIEDDKLCIFREDN